MIRTFLGCCAAMLLGATSYAQQEARTKIAPITAGVRSGGVLHLATGTWTRTGSEVPSIVYDNTCPSGYFAAQDAGAVYTDEGAIPNPYLPSLPSTAIQGAFDRNPGCAASYAISSATFGYCTYQTSYAPTISFQDRCAPIGAACAVPGQPTLTLSNLPGLPASPTGTQTCWIVTIDLTGTGPSGGLVLQGTGGAQNNLFAWSVQHNGPSGDGPILAGGVDVGTSVAPCSGTDGTRWDDGTASVAWPSNYGEDGTGMLNVDAFRVDGSPTMPPGCYSFGGNPRGSFYLVLSSDTPSSCTPCAGCGHSAYCFGDGTMPTACPCGNTGASGAGCDNSIGNGGAILGATGIPSLSDDTISFTQWNELGSSLSIVLQGTISSTTGIAFGDGVRCAAGVLKRLYVRRASDGTVTAPVVGTDPSVSSQSAILGDTISPGSTRYYGVYYRDPSASFCTQPQGNTWNIGNGVRIDWGA